MTVKLLSPTDIWTPAKNGSAWMRASDSRHAPELALAVAADGGDARVDDGLVVGETGDAAAGLLEQGPGRPPGVLGGPVHPDAARAGVEPLRGHEDGDERADRPEVEHPEAERRDGVQDRLPAAGPVRVVGPEAGFGEGRVRRVDGEGLGRDRLDAAGRGRP